MAKGKKMVILAGLGLAALFGLNQSAAWAGIPAEDRCYSPETTTTAVRDRTPVILARGGNDGSGSGGNGWKGGDKSFSRAGYGAQDGTGSATRARYGTRDGAGKGSGSGDCDGSGPKGKGRGNRTN